MHLVVKVYTGKHEVPLGGYLPFELMPGNLMGAATYNIFLVSWTVLNRGPLNTWRAMSLYIPDMLPRLIFLNLGF